MLWDQCGNMSHRLIENNWFWHSIQENSQILLYHHWIIALSQPVKMVQFDYGIMETENNSILENLQQKPKQNV